MASDIAALLGAVIRVFFTLLFVVIFFFVIYKGLLGKNERLKYYIKYNVLKWKYDPLLVKICVEAIEQDKTIEEVAKEKMLKGTFTHTKRNELNFIYPEVQKQIMMEEE